MKKLGEEGRKEAKEEGKGKGIEGREEREWEAVFYMREDGKWERRGIVLEATGASSYTVWVTGMKGREWEEEDWVICAVPNGMSLHWFLSLLTNDKKPLFTSYREHSPTNSIS